MRHESPLRRAVAALACAASLAAPTAASADSIVFVRDGDVWLAEPDGSDEYRVTETGGFRGPSMADDGTIVALDRDANLVRMRQNGEVLSRFAVIGSGPSSGSFEGPYDPVISPDGRRIAYWFIQRSSFYDPNCPCEVTDTRPHTTVTAAERFTDPTNAEAGAYRGPSWINSTRLLVADFAQVATYVAGGDNSALQRWYNDYQRAYAIARLDLTRDLSKLAVAHGDVVTTPTRMLLYTTDGRPWTDDGPPYDNFDPSRPRPNPPAPRCSLDPRVPISAPSWSSDGSLLTWSQPDGVWVARVPAALEDCSAILGGLAIPGASEPRFSPAPIAPGPRPGGPGGGGSGGGGTPGGGSGAAPRLERARLARTSFPARSGTLLRVRVSAPARLALTIQGRGATRRQRAVLRRAGEHSVRLRTRGLRPGRYALTVVAADSAGRRSRAVRLRFRIAGRGGAIAGRAA